MGLIIRVCDKNAVPFTKRQFTEYFNTSIKPEYSLFHSFPGFDIFQTGVSAFSQLQL